HYTILFCAILAGTEVKHACTTDLARCASDHCGRLVPQSGMDEAHDTVCVGCRTVSCCVAALSWLPAEARGGICRGQSGWLVQAVLGRHSIAACAALRAAPSIWRGCRRARAAAGLVHRTDGPGRARARTQLRSGNAMDELWPAGISCTARHLDDHVPRGACGAC